MQTFKESRLVFQLLSKEELEKIRKQQAANREEAGISAPAAIRDNQPYIGSTQHGVKTPSIFKGGPRIGVNAPVDKTSAFDEGIEQATGEPIDEGIAEAVDAGEKEASTYEEYVRQTIERGRLTKDEWEKQKAASGQTGLTPEQIKALEEGQAVAGQTPTQIREGEQALGTELGLGTDIASTPAEIAAKRLASQAAETKFSEEEEARIRELENLGIAGTRERFTRLGEAGRALLGGREGAVSGARRGLPSAVQTGGRIRLNLAKKQITASRERRAELERRRKNAQKENNNALASSLQREINSEKLKEANAVSKIQLELENAETEATKAETEAVQAETEAQTAAQKEARAQLDVITNLPAEAFESLSAQDLGAQFEAAGLPFSLGGALKNAQMELAVAQKGKDETAILQAQATLQKTFNDMGSAADKAIQGVQTLQTALDTGEIDQKTFDSLFQSLGFAEAPKSKLEQLKEDQLELENQIAREELQGAGPATPTGNRETTTINERPITVDSVAAPSLSEIDEEARSIGIEVDGAQGLTIGGIKTSSFRTSAQQKLLFDDPNVQAAKPGTSLHEKGMAIDLFPNAEYIEKMKPIMEENGWKQTVAHGDAGHFEYVGKEVRLTATEELAIKKLAVELMGKKSGTKPENVKTVRGAFIENDKSIDATEDAMRLGGFGVEFTGVIKNAFENINLAGFSAAQKKDNRETLEDLIKEEGADSNAVKQRILSMSVAGSNIGVDARNKVEGRVFAIENLEAIRRLLNEFTEAGGDTNIITGTEEKIARKLGVTTDPKIAQIGNEVLVAIQDYRRAITGAQFGESEAAEYDKLFPSIGNVPELNEALLDGLANRFEGFADTFYKQKIGRKNFEELFPTGVLPVLLGDEGGAETGEVVDTEQADIDNEVVSQAPQGEIAVRLLETGETGFIPRDEFNPEIYDLIQFKVQ